jgi:AraC-like DNA-binding protein
MIQSVPWRHDALPVVRVAGRFPLESPDFGVVYRTQTHAIHVHSYAGRMRIGRDEITLRPGDLTLSPAGVATSYALPRAGPHWCVHVLPWRGRHGDVKLPLHAPLGALAEHAGERIMSIARLLGGAGALSKHAASAAALELILWLAMQTGRHAQSSPTRGQLAAEQVAAIIHQRFAEPLFVPDLADAVQMSQNHLARIFRGWFGISIPRYLLARRIDAARHLLTATTIPIHRAAARVGIDDPQYFNKQFRRLVGMSPSAYRDSAKEQGVTGQGHVEH